MKGPLALLLWAAWLLAPRGSGQPYLRLRPSPSDHLPVKDILEHPDPAHDPREQDLDERALRKKLGSSFDPAFMSVAAPAPGNLSSPAPPARPLPGELRRLELAESPSGARLRLGKRARRKLLQWLWAYSHCPVRYTWKDLGVRFWPRYIKEGSCLAERSCSFPEGMSCKPAKSVPKTFLRWYCQGWARQKYCTWIPVQYPLISECKCAC